MPETFMGKIGYIAAILLLLLVFTGMGIALAPALAPLLIFFLALDIGGLIIVFGATLVYGIKERLQ